MRKILIVFGIFICCLMISAYRNPTIYFNNNLIDSELSLTIPDSILLLVENRPIIFYSYGHYGYSWSLLTKLDNDIKAFSGRTTYSGNKLSAELSENNKFDSIELFSANERLITWGSGLTHLK